VTNFSAADALSHNQNSFSHTEQVVTATIFQDPEGVRFEDCRLCIIDKYNIQGLRQKALA
jgi:hypothetical protein